jgi:hypothetical protein
MFFSVNDTNLFHNAHPELVRFVLNRDAKGLPFRYGVYMALYNSSMARRSGISATLQIGAGVRTLSEIAYPPFVFLLTFESLAPEGFVPISYFANYEYSERADIALRLLVTEAHTPFPADYRSKRQIEAESKLPLR